MASYKHVGYFNLAGDIADLAGRSADEIVNNWKKGMGASFFHSEEPDLDPDAVESTAMREKGQIRISSDGLYVIHDRTTDADIKRAAEMDGHAATDFFIDIYETPMLQMKTRLGKAKDAYTKASRSAREAASDYIKALVMQYPGQGISFSGYELVDSGIDLVYTMIDCKYYSVSASICSIYIENDEVFAQFEDEDAKSTEKLTDLGIWEMMDIAELLEAINEAIGKGELVNTDGTVTIPEENKS